MWVQNNHNGNTFVLQKCVFVWIFLAHLYIQKIYIFLLYVYVILSPLLYIRSNYLIYHDLKNS